MEAALRELGDEGIEERLKSVMATPSAQQYRLSSAIVSSTERGQAIIVVEVCRCVGVTLCCWAFGAASG